MTNVLTPDPLSSLAIATTHHSIWGEVVCWGIEGNLLRATFKDGRKYVIPLERVTLIREVPHGHEHWGKVL